MQNDNNANAKKIENKSETISELAHRHLLDESHTTSDEELRNAKVEFSEEPISTEGDLFEVDNTTVTGNVVSDTSDDVTNTDDENDDNADDNHGSPNPYNVLNP